jgi:hypothetical protein
MRQDLTIRGKYALFYGQWPSNWEPSPFVIDGKRYGCVEQWMMASKARLFGDKQAERHIMESPDPSDQKRYGRIVKGYDDRRWAAVRYKVVLQGTLEKYRQNPHLMRKLLDTGGLVFVEASPTDKIWGIGMRASDPNSGDPSKWRGQNLLGKAITEAKGILMGETL